MTNCMVLRCQEPGAVYLKGGTGFDVFESFVCQEHKDRMDAGEPWSFDEGRILMSQDVPPEATGLKFRDSEGTPGVAVTFETKDKSFEVFLRPKSVDLLMMGLKSRGTK